MDKVLLVDNDPEQLDAWADVLRTYYDVTTASSVPKAQEYLINQKFDLAVLDLHMERDLDPADESGLNLARLYREKVPIIMLTGLPTIESAVKALQRDGRASPAVALVRKKEDGPTVLLEKARFAIVPKVFVSHGRDDNATEAVVTFLQSRGVHPVVLKEQPTASETIIEAFEEHTNVQFAVILMTPDDEGRLKTDPDLKDRARQNVIFELGFLLAKLGRKRVLALMEEGKSLEVPSNYSGILYQEIDRWGKWQKKLASTMKNAGIELH